MTYNPEDIASSMDGDNEPLNKPTLMSVNDGRFAIWQYSQANRRWHVAAYAKDEVDLQRLVDIMRANDAIMHVINNQSCKEVKV